MSRPACFRTVAVLLTIGPLLLGQAEAITVIDPTNLVQNTLTAVRTLQVTNNQIRQLNNETQMLLNQARHLASLDFNAIDRLRRSLAQSERLLDEARGLAYEVARMDQEFARLYPERYSAATAGTLMTGHEHERWSQARDGIHTALRMQAQVSQNLDADQAVLADVLARSHSALGSLQATQATNQLLALQAKQAIQAQQLALAQGRAAALDQARQVAGEEQAREQRRRFMGTGTPYTPQPVRLFAR